MDGEGEHGGVLDMRLKQIKRDIILPNYWLRYASPEASDPGLMTVVGGPYITSTTIITLEYPAWVRISYHGYLNSQASKWATCFFCIEGPPGTSLDEQPAISNANSNAPWLRQSAMAKAENFHDTGAITYRTYVYLSAGSNDSGIANQKIFIDIARA